MRGFKEEVESMSFEQAMDALGGLVKELETGGTGLDQSIEIYEKAVILRDHCRKILEESERRIQKITETSEGLAIDDFKDA
ncbi:MAG: exodeoxyribonuclease VII small subunit [Candidatus Methanomethylophilaceae archaeon]|nr:exodeoxyribonuclease VII small subunit [Candidatus Methanomethylophilaceae archaeon]